MIQTYLEVIEENSLKIIKFNQVFLKQHKSDISGMFVQIWQKGFVL